MIKRLPVMLAYLSLALVAVVSLSPTIAISQPNPCRLTDRQIAEIIVERSRRDYRHSCPCPDDHARNGSLCGKRSAYSRRGRPPPYCYVSDVPDATIRAFCD
jgi:hypothetical protein